MKKCDNEGCYNYSKENNSFCEDCLQFVIDSMSCEDLYDIYLEGSNNIDQAIIDGEAHGLLTPRGHKAMMKCKISWFRLINKIMLKKIALEK